MSTDWGIGCRTCRDGGKVLHEYFSGEFENCRESSVGNLQKLVAAREEIVRVHAALGDLVRFSWLDFGDNWAGGIAEFFGAHVGHDLAAMNEYGDFHDDCDTYLPMVPGRGSRETCGLTGGHAGPCVPRDVKR